MATCRVCPSGMSASPTEVCGVYPATNHTTEAILTSGEPTHRNYKSFHSDGGHLAKSEIDRVAGKVSFDGWDPSSVAGPSESKPNQMGPARAGSSSTSFAAVSMGTSRTQSAVLRGASLYRKTFLGSTYFCLKTTGQVSLYLPDLEMNWTSGLLVQSAKLAIVPALASRSGKYRSEASRARSCSPSKSAS